MKLVFSVGCSLLNVLCERLCGSSLYTRYHQSAVAERFASQTIDFSRLLHGRCSLVRNFDDSLEIQGTTGCRTQQEGTITRRFEVSMIFLLKISHRFLSRLTISFPPFYSLSLSAAKSSKYASSSFVPLRGQAQASQTRASSSPSNPSSLSSSSFSTLSTTSHAALQHWNRYSKTRTSSSDSQDSLSSSSRTSNPSLENSYLFQSCRALPIRST